VQQGKTIEIAKGEVVMQKKRFMIMMGVVLAFGLLVGCSSGGGDPALDAPAGEMPADPTMVTPDAESPEAGAPEEGAADPAPSE
jgi:hypothetical protein